MYIPKLNLKKNNNSYGVYYCCLFTLLVKKKNVKFDIFNKIVKKKN